MFTPPLILTLAKLFHSFFHEIAKKKKIKHISYNNFILFLQALFFNPYSTNFKNKHFFVVSRWTKNKISKKVSGSSCFNRDIKIIITITFELKRIEKSAPTFFPRPVETFLWKMIFFFSLPTSIADNFWTAPLLTLNRRHHFWVSHFC